MTGLYRSLPSVDSILGDPRLADLPHAVVVAVARSVLDELRAGIAAGTLRAVPDVGALVVDGARVLLHGRLRRVVNATGVVVHTNLGRAPWPAEAVHAAMATAGGYCNLEMELDSGRRGGRLAGIDALLRHLTGAEAGLVVNNNAAAVLLVLTTFARGREVVVSRGELVEIGGSFRVPDVISSGGARLREVGTTNRTRIGDFASVIGPDTAVLLRVHRSNFRILGFTESPSREELAALSARHGLVAVEDLGSGNLEQLQDEPPVREVVASGLDLVTFSGDKLLGGPQAGLIVGKAEAVAEVRAHPMYRALRVDKVTLTAMEATLALHARGEQPPVQQMLRAGPDELRSRAESLREALAALGVEGSCQDDVGFSGGGALPARELPSVVVVLTVPRPHDLARALRTGEPAIVPRVADGVLRLDARTLDDADVGVVAARVAALMHGGY